MSEDKSFYDKVLVILGILIAMAAAYYVLAQFIAGGSQEDYATQEPLAVAQLEARIRPVRMVAIAGQENPDLEAMESAAAPVVQAAPVAATLSGPQVYNTACLACHTPGVAGAPKLGDKETWAPRIAQGMSVLKDHAINGYQGKNGYMPPKGGRTDLSDAEIVAAIEYMVNESS